MDDIRCIAQSQIFVYIQVSKGRFSVCPQNKASSFSEIYDTLIEIIRSSNITYQDLKEIKNALPLIQNRGTWGDTTAKVYHYCRLKSSQDTKTRGNLLHELHEKMLGCLLYQKLHITPFRPPPKVGRSYFYKGNNYFLQYWVPGEATEYKELGKQVCATSSGFVADNQGFTSLSQLFTAYGLLMDNLVINEILQEESPSSEEKTIELIPSSFFYKALIPSFKQPPKQEPPPLIINSTDLQEIANAPEKGDDAIIHYACQRCNFIKAYLEKFGATKLSRREFTNLTHSYVVMKQGETLLSFQWYHKAIGEDGFLAKGGVKIVHMLKGPDGKPAMVRAMVTDETIECIKGAIEAIAILKYQPYVVCGPYFNYISKKSNAPKHVFLSPYMPSKILLEFDNLKALDLKTKGLILWQMAQGVKNVHKYNLAHGDIKRANFFISYDPNNPSSIEVKIADFDFIQVRDEQDSIVRGSIAMMAPEIAKRECKTIKEAQQADIFSLGVTMYETYKCSDAPFMIDRLQPYCKAFGLDHTMKYLSNLTYHEILQDYFTPITSLDFLIWDMINPQEPANRPHIYSVINGLHNILLTDFGLSEKQLVSR